MRRSKIECECLHLHVSHRKRGDKTPCRKCKCDDFKGKQL